MAFTISLHTDELEAIAKKYAARARDLTPQLEVIGEDGITAVQDQFEKGIFQGLKYATVKRKLAAGKTAQPIVYNGTWKREHTKRVEATSVLITTTVPYAVYHVSSEARTIIPLRNPYDLPDEFGKEAAERLAHYIATGEVT